VRVPNGAPIRTAPLLRDERGYGINLQGMRRRFWKARVATGPDWQIRDLPAKAASDLGTTEDAQALLESL
jgi:hypothetical protein